MISQVNRNPPDGVSYKLKSKDRQIVVLTEGWDQQKKIRFVGIRNFAVAIFLRKIYSFEITDAKYVTALAVECKKSFVDL